VQVLFLSPVNTRASFASGSSCLLTCHCSAWNSKFRWWVRN